MAGEVGRCVYILGAGFSKAVGQQMPTLRELSAEVQPGSMVLSSHFDPEDLEAWLSYLAEDKPWADEASRLRHFADYHEVASKICEAITVRESEVRSAAMPEWLSTMIRRWHQTTATVVSFNYDTIVEAAFSETICTPGASGQSDPASPSDIYAVPVAPIASRVAGTWGSTPIETFSFMKLHGSTSWFYSGRPFFYGEVIYNAALGSGWQDCGLHPENDLYADKQPLIVPPTLGKAGYFDNEVVRGQWRRAHLALAEAEHVFLVGYSLPDADTLVAHLLRGSCKDQMVVWPVNPDLEVAERLRRVLPRAEVRTDYLGHRDAVEAMATAEDFGTGRLEVPPAGR